MLRTLRRRTGRRSSIRTEPSTPAFRRLTSEEIVNEHLLKGRPVKRLEYKDVDETVRDKVNVSLNDTTFYKTQKRVALRNCGVIDPENIDEYIAMDGYQALGKVLTDHDPGRRHQDDP